MKNKNYSGYVLRDVDYFIDLINDKFGSRQAFCDCANINVSIYYRLISGKRKATIKTAKKISDALNCDYHIIFLVNRSPKDAIKIMN